MKIRLNTRSYPDAFIEVTAAELDVLQRVLSKAVQVHSDALHADNPSIVLNGKPMRFGIDVLPEHTTVEQTTDE